VGLVLKSLLLLSQDVNFLLISNVKLLSIRYV